MSSLWGTGIGRIRRGLLRLDNSSASVKSGLEMILNACATFLRRRRGASDFRRWETHSNLSPDWDSRTKQIAVLIRPGQSVLEFGAGRMVLKKFLSESCRYTPSDLTDRGEATFVCDLNALALPDFPAHDVAVFSGVLEYVNDVPRLISRLAGLVEVVIASYAVVDYNPTKLERRACGWVNDYSSAEFEQIFCQCGFRLDRIEKWTSQNIYRFVRDDS